MLLQQKDILQGDNQSRSEKILEELVNQVQSWCCIQKVTS